MPASPPPPAPPLHISGRVGQLVVALLILFFLAWDMRAVLVDQRVSQTDTTVEDASLLAQALRDSGARGLLSWAHLNKKGPLAGPLVLGLDLALDDLLLAARILGVLLHGALLGLLCYVALALSRRWSCALAAVTLCGCYCGVYGWFRLEFHESLLAVAVLAALWRMTLPLRGARDGAWLGLTLGLGLLSKAAFPVFVWLPGLWFLRVSLRHRGGRIGVAVAAGVAAVLTAWWLIPVLPLMGRYAAASTGALGQDLLGKLWHAGTDIPGTGPLLALALIGAWLAARNGIAPARPLLLLALGIVGGFAALVLVFDPWARYIVPLFPVAGLLIALGGVALAERAARRWGRRPATAGALLLAALLLGRFCHDNIVGMPSPENERTSFAGMVAPDPAPYLAYPRIVDYVRRSGLALIDDPGTFPFAVRAVWERRGFRLPAVPPARVERMARRGEPIVWLFCHRSGLLDHEIRRSLPRAPGPATRAALAGWSREILVSTADPDGTRFTLVRFRR